MEYLSIYLIPLLFNSCLFFLFFCGFPHIDLTHILLDLYLFHFGGANVNGIMFLILNFTCSLLVYRKVVDFCVLTLYFVTLL